MQQCGLLWCHWCVANYININYIICTNTSHVCVCLWRWVGEEQ